MSVLDARTGMTRRDILDFTGVGMWSFSVGDVDGDSSNDIVAIDPAATSISAHGNLGSLLWTRLLPEMASSSAAINLADIDLDGGIDVIVGRSMLMSDGRSLLGTAGRGTWGLADMSCVADIDPASPGLEIAAGNTLYSSAGAVLWQALIPDGETSVADLDGDGRPEIVVVTQRGLYVLDSSGGIVGSTGDTWGANDWPVRALLADVDGDGLPEMVVACLNDVRCLKWQAGIVGESWRTPVRVALSIPRPTAFDFDCDGSSEVIDRDDDRWYIMDGRDGTILYQADLPSATISEMPVVANVDQDSNAEILVPSQGRPLLTAFEIPGSAEPRPIFNEIAFHGTNIDDDGRIPQVEPPHWLANNSDSAQTRVAPTEPCPPACALPSLGPVTVTDPSACSLGLLVSWEPPVFASGSGRVRLYRSDSSGGPACDDALARIAVASGVSSPWFDATTLAGNQYLYVVEAEDDARATPGCGTGPNGGFVSRSCSVVMPDAGDFPLPAPAGWTLRVAHDGSQVVLTWPSLRGLLPGEHLHIKRCTGPAPCTFVRVSSEGLIASSWAEPVDSSPLVLFDLRVASGCEDESPQDDPPSR